jgi:tetratricopeptide (TPR) repeat protein
MTPIERNDRRLPAWAHLMALMLGLCLAIPAPALAQDEDEEEEEDDEEDPDLDPTRVDEDDVDDWSFEGEEVKKEEVKEEKKKKELPPEAKRYGVSGHWYEIAVDCANCPTLLGQTLGIEDEMVMREFFDYILIASDRKTGEFIYPSASQKLPLGVYNSGNRVLIWQYVIDTGTRLTDTYAVIWDFQLKADSGLLYGRKYEVQAWTADAYEDWDRGYQAKKSFISSSKLKTYTSLDPVKKLDTDNPRFQVGDSARIQFVGYSGFVRSDVKQAAIAADQEKLKAAAEAEAKRARDQKEYFRKGENALDDRDWEDALTAFEKARSLGFESLDLNYNLGYAYYKLDDFDNAKKEYKVILKDDPRDTEVRYNLARIHEKEKNFDEAIKEYQAILKFNPDDSSARDRLELLKAARAMLDG